MQKVSIIGTGNVASHLAVSLFSKGVEIHQVCGRSQKTASALANQVKAESVTDLNELNTNYVDIILIAVSDDQISHVSNNLKSGNAIIAHTSGTNDLDILNNHSKTGVFYPLQTFSKNKPLEISDVPFCIEGNSKFVEDQLQDLAKVVSTDVRLIDSNTRKAIHLAAVFACNFTNHMWAISNKILEDSNQDLSLLKPLINETFNKAINSGPKNSQTGPAVRNDQQVMKKQLDSLKPNELLHRIYSDISASIKKMKNE